MNTEIDGTLILNALVQAYAPKSDAAFANYLGISPQTLSSWRRRNTFDINLIYSKCIDVNPHFLLTGKGPVKRSKLKVVEDDTDIYTTKTDRLITSEQIIPLYDIEASAGIVTLFSDAKHTQPIDFIQIPGIPKCDGALKITGDSMYPLLKSGDTIMYKQVHNIKDGIFWGEMYLISIDQQGDEMVTVKYIQKSEKGDQWIKLVSQNKHHDDIEVQIKKVRALALIKASIRINSMS